MPEIWAIGAKKEANKRPRQRPFIIPMQISLTLQLPPASAPLIDESCSYFSLIDYGILFKFSHSNSFRIEETMITI